MTRNSLTYLSGSTNFILDDSLLLPAIEQGILGYMVRYHAGLLTYARTSSIDQDHADCANILTSDGNMIRSGQEDNALYSTT